MSNENHVGSLTARWWQYYQLGLKTGIAVGVAANSVATIAIMGGGITANVGGNYIIRRVTVRNSSGSVSAANLSVSGPISGQITNTQGMAAVTGAGMFQDFTLGSTYINSSNATVTISTPATTTMLQDQFFNVNVLSAAAANNTVDVAIYGELINP